MSEETALLEEPQTAESPPPEGPPETPEAPAAEPPGDDSAERIAALEAELAKARVAIAESTHDKEALARIREAEVEVEEAAEEMESAKKVAAARKKDWESAVVRRQRVIREAQSGAMPLFDKPAPAAASPAEPKPAPAPEADDAWRGVLLTTLAGRDGKPLAPSILDALAERELLTVGDLADWSAPRPQGKGQRLIDVPGIGPGKAGQIEEALEEFWSRRAVDARQGLDSAVAEAVRETEAEQAGAPGPFPARPELTDANAWRLAPLADLGLAAHLLEACERGGLRVVQDLAFAVFTEWVDTLPGVETPEDLAEVRSRLDLFRSKLPDHQAFDFEEFAAEHIPAPADEKPVTESAERKKSRKNGKKGAPTA